MFFFSKIPAFKTFLSFQGLFCHQEQRLRSERDCESLGLATTFLTLLAWFNFVGFGWGFAPLCFIQTTLWSFFSLSAFCFHTPKKRGFLPNGKKKEQFAKLRLKKWKGFCKKVNGFLRKSSALFRWWGIRFASKIVYCCYIVMVGWGSIQRLPRSNLLTPRIEVHW